MSQDDLADDRHSEDWAGFAVALANTWDVWFENPEKLEDPVALETFLVAHGVPPDELVTEEHLVRVRELRHALRAVFQSTSAHEAIHCLAEVLDGVTVRPRVATSDEASNDVSVTYVPIPDASLLERIRVTAGLGTAAALQRWGPDRLRSCDADRCEDVFVDTSRNGRRRYCGVRCQNRVNVAAMRQRTSTAGTSPG